MVNRNLFSFVFWGLIIISLSPGFKYASGDENLVNKNEKKSWAIKIADSFINSHPGSVTYDTIMTRKAWNYEQGLILEALHQMFLYTGDDKYFKFIKENIDQYVDDNGEIATYDINDYNLDQINTGRQILFLYEVTDLEKYKAAAELLEKQLKGQPKNQSGGYWHKKIYPDQMWLDGVYMAEPFAAQYAKIFKDTSNYSKIARQFLLIAEHTLDPKTGLFYHAWDESKKQKWSDPKTGCSPNFWGRAMGWYLMAAVDVLDFFPANHPGREKIITIFRNLCKSLIPFIDKKTNLWYQVVDQGNRKGNYLETSASAMFAYAFAKGYNKGYLDAKFLQYAKSTFAGIIKEKVKFNKAGFLELYGTCGAAGLGNKPYRDGSFDYYISEPTRINDYKGYGSFLLAAIEIEKAANKQGMGIIVGLDNFYNREIRKNKAGSKEDFHYVWNDTTNSGYSELGKIFKQNGAKVKTIKKTASENSLKNLNIYIIVDPDTPKESPAPNYIDSASVSSIKEWVSRGGMLMLFANDAGNCEFDHLNKLAENFGFHFNEVSLNRVEGSKFEMGQFTDLPYYPLFSGVNKIYMKEISTIKVDEPQHKILNKDGEAVIAIKKFGRGVVIAIGDPWLYNEYIDNRKLPVGFENYKAAVNLVKWLITLSKNTR